MIKQMKDKMELQNNIRDIIYDYIYEEFGESEANNPSWYIPALAEEIADRLIEKDYEPKHSYYNIDDEE